MAHNGTAFADDGPTIRLLKGALATHTTSNLGEIQWEGRDSSNFLHEYGALQHWLYDNTAAGEESEFRFLAHRNGVRNEFLTINRQGDNAVKLGATVNLDMNGNDIIDTPLITSTAGLELTSGGADIILDSGADVRLEPGASSYIEHIGPVTDHYVSIGSLSGTRQINLQLGNYFAGSLVSSVNFQFISESGTADQVNWFVLLLNKSTGATITITWPSEVDWPGGTAPAVPGTNEQDAYAFFTINGGTTWYGFHVGDNLQ